MRTRNAVAALAVFATIGCADGSTDPLDLAESDPPLLGAGASGAPGAGAPLVISQIEVTDLGTLPGGANSVAWDINDAGEIVGGSDTGSGESHAFILTSSGISDLGTFPGGDFSLALGINGLGQVVGFARNAAGVYHGFFWESGAIEDLGAYPPEDDIGSESFARAINDAGLIAGSVDLTGVVWDLNGTPNFPPFPPNVVVTSPGPFTPAQSFDINDAGQVAGTLLAYAQGFRWQAGTLESLAVLGALDDDAFGINDAGHVVGRALLPASEIPPVRYHAVLWPDPATVVDLGALGGGDSEARDINDDGVVVGWSDLDSGDRVAMVWVDGLGMHSLGTLGGANSAAYAINATGQIVGESETATGESHAALWTIELAIAVDIDVKPGSGTNPVNPRSRGVIPVALFGTDYLDVTTVDPSTLAFGPDGAGIAHGSPHSADLDSDGLLDLMLHFRTQDTGIRCGDTEATLVGLTSDGEAIQGTDPITTVGCGP